MGSKFRLLAIWAAVSRGPLGFIFRADSNNLLTISIDYNLWFVSVNPIQFYSIMFSFEIKHTSYYNLQCIQVLTSYRNDPPNFTMPQCLKSAVYDNRKLQ